VNPSIVAKCTAVDGAITITLLLRCEICGLQCHGKKKPTSLQAGEKVSSFDVKVLTGGAESLIF
jgi:hypothetical protein